MLSDVCQARTKAAMLLLMKITTSRPNIGKPIVSRSPFFQQKCFLIFVSGVLRSVREVALFYKGWQMCQAALGFSLAAERS